MNAAFPELNWQIPQSTYLAWLDLRPLNIDDNALQKALIEQEKVAIMPGYTYGEEGRGFVRLNAGCPRSKLEKGVAGLINAIRAIAQRKKSLRNRGFLPCFVFIMVRTFISRKRVRP